ncbi:helicase-exonuclease AddAB subunit AddA [Weissella diestrammenae]|uniref:ATP-dependent helicase/nuclease subunit A n=1 Tax=Weissella diestrammenae TaxID=1162633 RepID=A0A7G9T6P8_9LACO|nr:helicase-exonuclease AddAB subunit AddA [Weissella diestrammenae]MCM0582941.1 helicase-exonuclease AddAB subunit AddA [Weissella diestrammenae]QNN75773.1 helicase-exonuclease AddAB subunit AddA [Weissella diestrammenae]
MEFTKQQQQAIVDRNQNILVSASAGSGKTRVLVERVLQRLKQGDNLDGFLIVTFTEAAAAEMRERLENEIRQAANQAEGEGQQHLRRQLRLLRVTNISTVDAFALRLIEQYHYTIDLDPQFRIADNAERQLTMMQIFDTVLTQQYENDQDDRFKTFAKQFIKNGSDSALQQAVFKLFNFAMARPDTDEWLAQLSHQYQSDGDFLSSQTYLVTLLPEIKNGLTDIRHQYQQIVDLVQEFGDDLEGAPLNRKNDLLIECNTLNVLSQQLTEESNWGHLRQQFLSLAFTRWNAKGRPLPRNMDDESKATWQQITALRSASKEQYQELVTKIFVLDEVGITTAVSGAQQNITQLVALTNQFRAVYLAEKIQKRVFDFNDLEHFALQIVSQPKIAATLAQQYVEIMVDEYQDTSYLQEAIVQAIAKPNNVFQVGDIKQSIYKFRQADPKLFANKMKNYPLADTQDSEVITLAENFRSQPNVTQFINYLFMQFMSDQLGGVTYTGEAKLVAGASYYPLDLPKKAELMVYFNDADSDEDQGENVADEPVDVSGYNATTGQITMLGAKIKTMVAEGFTVFDRRAGLSRPVRYADITILVPSRSQNPQVIDIFKVLDIPLTVNDSGNYFQTLEISVMMSLLKIIDNPHQDVPLVTVLRSPIYQVGENGLAMIRAQQKQGDFYDALQHFMTLNSDQVSAELKATFETTQAAGKRLLQDLADFKTYAIQNQIVQLIWAIYQRTGWLDYVSAMLGGNQRQANLHALYERAAAYQQTNFTGLYQFNRYIEQLQKNAADDLGEADANESSDTVKLMTIHGSKGLEFPIVFMLNANKGFNTEDQSGQMIIDADAGVGMQYLDLEHALKLTPPQYLAVRSAINRSSFAEQLRVLYVALTRAEQQLFIVGAYKKPEELLKKWQLAYMPQAEQWMLDDAIRLQANSFMDLIGMALARHPQFEAKLKASKIMSALDLDNLATQSVEPDESFEFSLSFQNSNDVAVAEQAVQAMGPVGHVDDDRTDSVVVPTVEHIDLQNVFDFRYPHEMATRTTAYQSVSEIKRLFEDPDIIAGQPYQDQRLASDETQESGLRFTQKNLREPHFLTEMATRPSGAARGTATHLVMQKVDLSAGAPTIPQVEQLIETLIAEELIEPTLQHLIPVKQIVAFFNDTTLGKQMVKHADTLQREVPFSMLMAAKTLYQDYEGDERVLVHGIIDGYFMVDQTLWLYDYKTDYIAPEITDAKAFLQARYQSQLNVYASALTAMGQGDIRRFVMSFGANKVYEF